MKKLLFMGPPNAGKGTSAEIVSVDFKIPHIASGDMFREAIKNQTEIGLEAKKFIDEGKLVPDEVTIKLVEDRLEKPDCADGFILDGFPRTLPQAEELDKVIEIDQVILLETPDEVIMERVANRVTCRKCGAVFNTKLRPAKVEGVCDKCGGELYQRDDDKPESVKKRLLVYAEQTAPLIKFYENKGILSHINAGARGVPEIVDDIKKAIGS